MDGQPVPESESEVISLHVPRLLRLQDSDDEVAPHTTPGYHPLVSISMAEGHSWVLYKDLKPTLRDLMFTDLSDNASVFMARRKLKDLMHTPPPFSLTRRFPAGEVYVCLDRLPLGHYMLDAAQFLQVTEDRWYRDDRTFHSVISEVMELLDNDEEGPFPLFYRRCTFESAFLLCWIE